jgi:hypothetical protein
MYQLAYDPSIAGVVRFFISYTEVASRMTDSHRRLVADDMTKTVTTSAPTCAPLDLSKRHGTAAETLDP